MGECKNSNLQPTQRDPLTILLVREGGEVRPTGVWHAAPGPGADDPQDVVPNTVR